MNIEIVGMEEITNQRITRYKELLKLKYGPRVVDALLKVSYENNTISTVKDWVALNKFIEEYRRNNDGCKNLNFV